MNLISFSVKTFSFSISRSPPMRPELLKNFHLLDCFPDVGIVQSAIYFPRRWIFWFLFANNFCCSFFAALIDENYCIIVRCSLLYSVFSYIQPKRGFCLLKIFEANQIGGQQKTAEQMPNEWNFINVHT